MTTVMLLAFLFIYFFMLCSFHTRIINKHDWISSLTALKIFWVVTDLPSRVN